MTYHEAYEKLKKWDQLHVLNYYDALSEEQKTALLEQISVTDFSVVKNRQQAKELPKKGIITPLEAMEVSQIAEHQSVYEKIGMDAIRAGKVGAVLLAGGMGTRLGSEDPKGMYDIGLTKNVFIFQRLIENLLEVVKKAEAWIPLYVMTSDKNHEKTCAFFEAHDYFGYRKELVFFFMQEMAPATDYTGHVYMEEKHKISTSPNGNGGWFVSMDKWGILDKVHEAGVEWLNVFAVDNVLQRIADPVFVGATIATKSEVGAKVVRKSAPDEKVGVMCREDGRPSIVEYYELTDELMNAKDAKGNPAYNFGVILNYLFSVRALEEIMERQLPLHVVEKKIPYLDEQGHLQKPEEPNGFKYEQLILDMIHELKTCLPFEVERNREFAPIKNKTGIDSVESARALCKENGIEL
ncbi:MAG: UDPGP type 1 family protein [bacterium]|nr:UDPGP type 1 family protein [bacterium]